MADTRSDRIRIDRSGGRRVGEDGERPDRDLDEFVTPSLCENLGPTRDENQLHEDWIISPQISYQGPV